MYQPARHNAPNAAFLWPVLLAASASEMTALFAKQFTTLAIGAGGETAPQPQWTTPHHIALELKTVRLRDFATEPHGRPCLMTARRSHSMVRRGAISPPATVL